MSTYVFKQVLIKYESMLKTLGFDILLHYNCAELQQILKPQDFSKET